MVKNEEVALRMEGSQNVSLESWPTIGSVSIAGKVRFSGLLERMAPVRQP